MENTFNKAFALVFGLLAILAFVGICLGAYHQIVSLIICGVMAVVSYRLKTQKA